MIIKNHPRPTSFKALQIARNATIQRAIMPMHQTENGTSREAKAQIDLARKALNDPNLTPEARKELQTRIEEAKAQLSHYRATIGSFSLGMNPMLATTTTGPANLLIAAIAGLALLGSWILGSNASRAPANRVAAEKLALALRRLSKAVQYARSQSVPPRGVPAPRPPGEVIPIETHPRFTPRAPQQSRPPQLGPDIFPPVPWPEPVPEQPQPRHRNERFEKNPTFIHCDK